MSNVATATTAAGTKVRTAEGVTGVTVGEPTLTPTGHVVTVKFDDEFAATSPTGGADFAVEELELVVEVAPVTTTEATQKTRNTDYKARAAAEPTDLHKAFAAWIEEQTGVKPDLKTVQIVCSMRMDFQRSEENQAALAKTREVAAAKKAAKEAAALAKKKALLAKLQAELEGKTAKDDKVATEAKAVVEKAVEATKETPAEEKAAEATPATETATEAAPKPAAKPRARRAPARKTATTK